MAKIEDHPSQEYDTYLGNVNLKAENVSVQFTEDQIEEYLKCKDDPIYFIENYVQIVHVDKGLVPFEMYDFQKQLVKTVNKHRFTIAKLPRQVGKSTTLVSYFLWVILFHKLQSCAIIANKADTARDILSRLQKAYEHLPKWIQQGVKEWNKGSVVLENGSKIVALSTGNTAARGGSYNMVMLDEFAFVPRNIAEEFITSVYPVITSGQTTKIIMVSTPNGMNLFYKFWTDAKNKRNRYIPIEAHWSDVPGRDRTWEKETRANLGDERFEQEFGCEFLGGANTLIAPSKLSTLTWVDPAKKWQAHEGIVDAYDLPEKDHTYVIPVDTSHGQGIDYSAFTVIDVTKMPYKVVAKYRCSDVDPLLYPEIIVNVAKLYNDAHLLVETNDIGLQTVNTLYHELEYEYIFATQTKGRAGQKLSAGFQKGAKLGVKTSTALKRIGCANLKSLIENDQLLIEDYHIIEEFSTFIRTKRKAYEAEVGTHDDLVMTLVLFGWLAQQQYFKDITEQDIRKKLYSDKLKKMDEDAPPMMGIQRSDGGDSSFVDKEGTRWFPVSSDDDPWIY